MNLIKHKHHIVPKHAGGKNDSSNIVELTIEEHAQAHKQLFETYGRIEDRLAWLGLSGQIGKDEILIELAKSKRGIKRTPEFCKNLSEFRKTFRYSEESKRKMSLAKLGKKNSPEHIEKSRLGQLGKKQTEYQKLRAKECLERLWLITKPNGDCIEIKNLNQFCKDNNLDQGNMVKVSKGILKQHKGYVCKKIS